MAFDLKGLTVYAHGSVVDGHVMKLMTYATDDSVSTVTADGYFDGALDNGLNKGDVIRIVFEGGASAADYLVAAGGKDVTVTALVS